MSIERLVVHLIPYDAIGGVEVAAASVRSGSHGGFRLRKAFIAEKGHGTRDTQEIVTRYRSENDPRAFLVMVWRLLRDVPDLLVLSLWRCCIIGLLVKLLRPRTRLVLFLHNTRDAHLVDGWVTRLTAALSHEIWADSLASAAERLGPQCRPVRPISFLTSRQAPVTAETPVPRLIFWGRLHPRKRIDSAIRMMATLVRLEPEAQLDVIGPDGGSLADLRQLVAEMRLGEAVHFVGPLDHRQIAARAAKCSVFVQTSAFEGMAMAVVEAMQMGLVPLVTPVGEVASYVQQGVSGLWFVDSEASALQVAALLQEPERFRAMRAAAIRHWSEDVPLYRDSFLGACEAALA